MDAYDKAIAWLREQEDFVVAVNKSWKWGQFPVYETAAISDHPAYFLFGSVGRHRCNYGTTRDEVHRMECGCLTIIKRELKVTGTIRGTTDSNLLEEINKDDRVPYGPEMIQDKDLELFAYYQRKADAIFNRPAPVWEGPELVTQGE